MKRLSFLLRLACLGLCVFAFSALTQAQGYFVPIHDITQISPALGLFHSISGIAVDANGAIYVADFYNNRIEKFNAAGDYQTEFGYSFFDQRYFGGLALDAGSALYAVNYDSGVAKFDSSNSLVGGFNFSNNYSYSFKR